MFIPLRHERMHGRRWPVVTLGLIALNLFVFLGTHWQIEQQAPESGTVRAHILMLAAAHPELHMPDGVEAWVTRFREKNPSLWKQLQNGNREVEDGWDVRMRMEEDPEKWQQEMDALCTRFNELQSASLLARYAFTPANPRPLTYLTSEFLHGGWLHLIGNMWFLWLAGFILEDTWGRPIYLSFYLLAGVFATQVHAWTNPGSLAPALGASGAVAGLMGAFLTRFPTVKIEIAWIFGFGRIYRFKAAAYWLLPFWLLMEIFSGVIFGQLSGVAHWAHVGGFVFGAVVALAIRKSGLEHAAEEAIQEKIAWVSHPLLASANESLEKGQLDAAEQDLQKLIQEQPESAEAHRMLQQIYWRKSNVPAHLAALEKLLAIHLKSKDAQEALHTFQEYRSSGGQKLPASTWLELCRLLEEDQQGLEVAVQEYAALAAAYPTEKQALLANMSAGRLCLKRLNRPSDALHFYQEAKASRVPHLDWDANIERGIEEANKARQASASPVAQF
jgi:membrane associated rhomboid family serine protease